MAAKEEAPQRPEAMDRAVAHGDRTEGMQPHMAGREAWRRRPASLPAPSPAWITSRFMDPTAEEAGMQPPQEERGGPRRTARQLQREGTAERRLQPLDQEAEADCQGRRPPLRLHPFRFRGET